MNELRLQDVQGSISDIVDLQKTVKKNVAERLLRAKRQPPLAV